jgi:hypothetical protein
MEMGSISIFWWAVYEAIPIVRPIGRVGYFFIPCPSEHGNKTNFQNVVVSTQKQG